MTVKELEAARAGAGWAFEGIYAALAGPVRRFLSAQGSLDPDALTQDVFVRVFGGLGGFDGDAEHLRSWVFTVARNLLIDQRRAAARRPVIAEAAVPERGVPGAEDDAVTRVDAGRVRDVLDALPPTSVRWWSCGSSSDLPLAEVATITARSTSAVKALQHRGLAGLRRRLEDPAVEAASSVGGPTFTTA